MDVESRPTKKRKSFYRLGKITDRMDYPFLNRVIKKNAQSRDLVIEEYAATCLFRDVNNL